MCVCAHMEEELSRLRYHISRWKTGVHSSMEQPLSKHLPPLGWAGLYLQPVKSLSGVGGKGKNPVPLSPLP